MDCLFRPIQIKMTMLKGIKAAGIIYQKVLLRIIMSSSLKRTFMINQLFLM